MGSLARATLAALIGLAAASLIAGPVVAEEGDAYYPALTNPKTGPEWEQPKSTHFQAVRCSAGALIVDKLVLNRDDVSETKGFASYTDSAKDRGYQTGAGGWTLAGDQLNVSGDGFELAGRWVGPFLTATITRPGGGAPARCRFQVTALRSFTEYQ
jgi:hypothetical protein